MRFHQFAKAHQDPRAAQRRERAPGRKRRGGRGDRRVDIGGIGQRHVPHHFALGGVGDFAEARGLAGNGLAADPQRQPFECGQVHPVSLGMR